MSQPKLYHRSLLPRDKPLSASPLRQSTGYCYIVVESSTFRVGIRFEELMLTGMVSNLAIYQVGRLGNISTCHVLMR